MIVVDASTLAKYILREENWRSVSAFIREKKPLYSLDQAAKEVGSALWKHYRLRKVADREVVTETYLALLKLFETGVVILENERAYLGDALRIALDYGAPLYDSLYLAQAQKHGELLTSDKSQANVARKLGVKTYTIF